MRRALSFLLAMLALALPASALAKVTATFHSYDGSRNFGRFAHTFVVLRGIDDATGNAVDENYGFSARRISPRILMGPVEHIVMTEKPDYIARTRRHFSIELTQAQFDAIRREVAAWRDAPGKYYDLDTRNCIHFVGRLAELAGLNAPVPKSMTRKPGTWLEHVRALNRDRLPG
ncbi:hypothetical protein GRI40_08475 [Altererythrobacter aerius]|uniref:DUF4105 domain-containing protein n=1 Tax=Tsuneonella aeria TaxID=1837929 RepID=A0A6I4TCI0_9SPHN|nr:hypothetical protein [Tsuneonella aeria]MXO75249.1 hypothetical protein [Tsuneonella aeria]